jgi:hypothetical protein
VELRDEAFDDEIDSTIGPDYDSKAETGLELAMGLLKANPAKLLDGTKRARIWSVRVMAGRQVLAAVCNETWLGTDSGLDLDAAVATLAGTEVDAILALNDLFASFNEAGDALPSPFPAGPADPRFAGDDPTDPWCGLGAELVLVLPPAMWWRRRRGI